MKKRGIVVGAGGMGRAWGRNLVASDRAELAGFVDVVPGKAEEANSECGAPEAYGGTDLLPALEAVKPDFVVDVTIPEAHCQTVVTALRAGYPVIGEKPMANSMEEAGEMVRASQETGLLYMVSQSRRYLENLGPFKTLVHQSGAPVMGLYADFFVGPHFGGFRDAMDSPLVLDMSIHHFDMARAILDLDPVAVYADEFNPEWSWYQGDACANLIYEMEGGVRFVYRGSWCAEGMATDWNAEWRVIGKEGHAFWNGGEDVRGQLIEKREGFIYPTESMAVPAPPKDFKGGIEGSLDEFLTALETGATPQGEASDNIKSLAMVFGALKSSREKRRVLIEEVMP